MPLFRSGFVADHGIRLEQLDGDGNRGGGVMPASAVSENTVINALAILLNPSSYPVLVCCSLGRHNTGSTSRCYIATRHRIRGCLPLHIPARFPFAVVIKRASYQGDVLPRVFCWHRAIVVSHTTLFGYHSWTWDGVLSAAFLFFPVACYLWLDRRFTAVSCATILSTDCC